MRFLVLFSAMAGAATAVPLLRGPPTRSLRQILQKRNATTALGRSNVAQRTMSPRPRRNRVPFSVIPGQHPRGSDIFENLTHEPAATDLCVLRAPGRNGAGPGIAQAARGTRLHPLARPDRIGG